jgi:5-methylthioadenosine/S-adenosylhomocysteine deaminase
LNSILIRNAIIVTINEKNEIIEDGSILIEGSKIKDIGPTNDISTKYSADKEIDASGMVAMPGLINSHMHLTVPAPRATYDDKGIMDYFLEIYAMANKYTEEAVYKLSLLSALEALKSGTTFLNTHGHWKQSLQEEEIHAINDIGIKAMVCMGMQDIMHPWNLSAEEQVNQTVSLVEEYSFHDMIQIALGPETIDYMMATTKEFVRGIADIAKQYNLKVHTHAMVSSGEQEIPLEWWQDSGLLNSNLIVVHCLGIGKATIQAFKKNGVSIVHCPSVWAKLGRHHGEWIPLKDILGEGVNVSLGTDGPGLHSSSDMFREMSNCALLNNVFSVDPWLRQENVLRMATINGAKTLGIESEIGSIERGKRADIILVDMNKPHLHPLNNVIGLIVFAVTGQDVDTVIIDGKIIMERRRVHEIDEAKIIDEAEKAFHELYESAGWKVSLGPAKKPKTPVFFRLPNKMQVMKTMARWGGRTIVAGK